jgi:LPS sulfotransferase NodH
MTRTLSRRQLHQWQRPDRELRSWWHQRVLKTECRQPHFIIGCGRSGTTALGQALEQHHEITYLHEPRSLWTEAYPETDIWSAAADRRGGRLVLTAADARPPASRHLRRLFHAQTVRTGRAVLMEKLPINSFRLPFLHAIFPAARYIHIRRDGVEVARSIERLCRPDGWYGVDDVKWQALVNYSRTRPEWESLPELCDSAFRRGLLEWRLSEETAACFFAEHPAVPCLTLAYDELVSDAVSTLARALDFVGLELDSATRRHAERELARRSAPAADQSLDRVDQLIGGPQLHAGRCLTPSV